jgi:hypothetical protein
VKVLAATVALPVFIGLGLGALALTIGLSADCREDAPPLAERGRLERAETALVVQLLLVHLAREESAAFATGGLKSQPLDASPEQRRAAHEAYHALADYLEDLESRLSVEHPNAPLLDELISLWDTYLRLAVSWLEVQQELEADSGFNKYLERPLKSERPYLVEVDRLLARADVERARAMGGIVLGQRSLVWRRGAEISAAVLAR